MEEIQQFIPNKIISLIPQLNWLYDVFKISEYATASPQAVSKKDPKEPRSMLHAKLLFSLHQPLLLTEFIPNKTITVLQRIIESKA